VQQLTTLIEIHPQAARRYGVSIQGLRKMTYDDLNILRMQFATGVGT